MPKGACLISSMTWCLISYDKSYSLRCTVAFDNGKVLNFCAALAEKQPTCLQHGKTKLSTIVWGFSSQGNHKLGMEASFILFMYLTVEIKSDTLENKCLSPIIGRVFTRKFRMVAGKMSLEEARFHGSFWTANPCFACSQLWRQTWYRIDCTFFPCQKKPSLSGISASKNAVYKMGITVIQHTTQSYSTPQGNTAHHTFTHHTTQSLTTHTAHRRIFLHTTLSYCTP